MEAEVEKLRDDIDTWCGMYRIAAERAEKAEKDLKRCKDLLTAALPHIECTTQEQDGIITAIGEALGL